MFGSLQAFGGNWYVNKAASGANNGTNWTNAWTEMNQINWSMVACGDTIWLAGGTYTTGLTINKTCTSSTVLNINRVLSTDPAPTAAAGWNTSYDSQVVISDATINVAGGAYYTINGRQGGVPSVNFGIRVQCVNGGGGCDAVDGAGSGNISNVTLTHLELFGPSCVMSGNCGGGGASGLNIAPSSNTVNSLLLDHSWIHQWGETIRTSNWNNSTIQYSWVSDTNNDGQQHEDLMYSYPSTNLTWRYNHLWGSPNDGMFHEYGGAVNLKFYGNVVYHSGGWEMAFKAGNSYGPVFIYNNTFQNDGFGDYSPAWLGQPGTLVPGSEIANNIFYNVDNQISPSFSDYNAYSTGGASEPGVVHFTSGSPLTSYNGFVNMSSSNPPAADFHLTAAGAVTFQNGKTLSTEYATDPDGNTRGANGNWYMGAYQYGSSQSGPTPPTGLSAAVQ
jgi:hypothetical protein